MLGGMMELPGIDSRGVRNELEARDHGTAEDAPLGLLCIIYIATERPPRAAYS